MITKQREAFIRLHNEALEVQNACNLSGVIHSFSEAMTKLWEIQQGGGTSWVNCNAVTRLYASKIIDLTGSVTSDDFDVDLV